jgi:hypothetical protein
LRRFPLTAIALLLIVSIPQGVLASGTGTHLASFLEVDAGARQIAMGGAFTGLADDAMCVFYNPAGLKFVRGSEIHMNTSSWPGGLTHQHLAYGFRHSYLPGIFAFSWSVMQMSPYLEKTEYFDPESDFGIGIGDDVDAGDMAFGGSYCWDFGDGLSVAATLRWYHLGMAEAFCEGICGDLGVLWDTRFRNLRLGASVVNLGPSNRWAGTGSETGFGETYSMPTAYRAGASMRIFDVVRHRIVVTGEYKYTSDADPLVSWLPDAVKGKLHAGTEYTFNKGKVFVYGRVGYRYNYDEEGITFGTGVRFPSSSETEARLDYSYIQMDNLDDTQRLALTFIF